MRNGFAGLALALTALAAHAQEVYPSRPITMIVPFPPGGVADITGRPTAAALEKVLKQPVTINNRPGAGGKVGNAAVANAKPDGYTIMMALSSVSVLPEADKLFEQKPAYTLDKLAPIALITADPVILVVHPSLPARTVRELITLARAQHGGLLYASAGNGTPPHLAAELFKLMTNTQIGHVPYKGNAQAMTDLIAGQTAMSFPTIPSALPHVQTAKLRALGVTSAKRVGALPNIPAIAETVAGYDGSAWYGVMAPAGTPGAIVTRLHGELMAALRTPELKDKLVAQGLEPASYTPEEFSALIVSELAKWAKVVAAAGVKNE